MALRQLILNKKITEKRAAIAEMQTAIDGFKTRSEEIEKAIEEASTEEEMKVVEEEAETLENEKEEKEAAKGKLEEELEALETELEGMKANEPKEQPGEARKSQKTIETRERGVEMTKRERMMEYLKREEVQGFYNRLSDLIKNKRSITDVDLTIPEETLNRIQMMVGDYSNLYKEVEVITLNGTGRVIVNGAIPTAVWVEMCDPLQALEASLSKIELDGYKVGGYITVCNAILEDSMIDLANYVETTIAQAIAKAIDEAILNGTGAVGKQPEGIVPNIPVGSQTTATTLAEILTAVSLIDTGEGKVGEVIAVMNRKTYYAKILPQTIATTSDGKQVVQGVSNPNIAGLRVVFSNYADDDKIVLGDYKKYLLGERKGVQLESSTHVKFIEDQTVFKGTARYDGKPTETTAFALVELVPAI